MKTSLPEEQHGLPRWWLSPDGKLLQCDDHDFMARQILRKEEPGFIPVRPKDTCDKMLHKGWVRVVRERQELWFDALQPLTRSQRTALRDLSIECGLPLYDTIRRRILDEADALIDRLLDS